MKAKKQRTYLAALERYGQPLLSRRGFIVRMLLYSASATLVVLTALGAGMLGYHVFERLSWLDAFLNAAMILGGMGPVNAVQSVGGKLFAGCYALFSGLIFVVAAGVLLTPVVHRLLHHFHVETQTVRDRD